MVLAGELWSEQEEEGRRKREVPWFSRKVEGGDYLEEGEVGHQGKNWIKKTKGHVVQADIEVPAQPRWTDLTQYLFINLWLHK